MNFEFTSIVISILGALLAAVTAILTIYSYKQKNRSLHQELERLAENSALLKETLVAKKFNPAEKSEHKYLTELVRHSPSAAILASVHELEKTLQEKSSAEQKNVENDLSPNIRSLISQLRVLRNKIAHEEEIKVDPSLALEFVELTSKLTQDIRETPT